MYLRKNRDYLPIYSLLVLLTLKECEICAVISQFLSIFLVSFVLKLMCFWNALGEKSVIDLLQIQNFFDDIINEHEW
jgi:hypothetical protein